jgi:hypothetical protein
MLKASSGRWQLPAAADLIVTFWYLRPARTAIVERYRRRESSVEEALIEMYQSLRITPSMKKSRRFN